MLIIKRSWDKQVFKSNSLLLLYFRTPFLRMILLEVLSSAHSILLKTSPRTISLFPFGRPSTMPCKPSYIFFIDYTFQWISTCYIVILPLLQGLKDWGRVMDWLALELDEGEEMFRSAVSLTHSSWVTWAKRKDMVKAAGDKEGCIRWPPGLTLSTCVLRVPRHQLLAGRWLTTSTFVRGTKLSPQHILWLSQVTMFI